MDEDARITITFKPQHLERLAYWIVIAGLATLLVLAFLKDDACTSPAATPPPAAQPAAPAPQPTVPEESCTDGVKNQDETDVDCGGACSACVSGKACETGSDCASTYCTVGVCTATAPIDLSGDVEFDVTKAYTTVSPTGTVKLTGIDYKIANGLEDDLDGYVIKVFVKNKAGTRCLNQEVSGTCDQSYVEFSGSAVRSGRNTTQTKMFDDGDYTTTQGRYLIEDNGYDPADSSLDDFQAVAYLYDSAGGEIDDKTISDALAVNPT